MKKFGLFLMLLCGMSLNVWAAAGESTAIESSSALSESHNFKVENYVGTWYEVARLPMHYERNCLAPITANYELNQEGLKITNRCKLDSGEFSVSYGQATFAKESDIGKLKVSFAPSWISWTGLATGDYWVLYTDYSRFALVGSPDKKYLWILARQENNSSTEVQRLIDMARKLGYPTQNMIFNAQAFKLD
jgi:apolipoprotein D and lipocalin family protein